MKLTAETALPELSSAGAPSRPLNVNCTATETFPSMHSPQSEQSVCAAQNGGTSHSPSMDQKQLLSAAELSAAALAISLAAVGSSGVMQTSRVAFCTTRGATCSPSMHLCVSTYPASWTASTASQPSSAVEMRKPRTRGDDVESTYPSTTALHPSRAAPAQPHGLTLPLELKGAGRRSPLSPMSSTVITAAGSVASSTRHLHGRTGRAKLTWSQSGRSVPRAGIQANGSSRSRMHPVASGGPTARLAEPLASLYSERAVAAAAHCSR